ncbi:MAG: LuxR C-terminal-related transcriptional regulator [Ilumatobacteraceae bacterium]
MDQVGHLPPEMYAKVFDVLERCDAAESLGEFKDRMLDALGSVFGYEHTTCFAGASVADAFQDRSPLLRGRTVRCWDEYVVRWYGRDVLAVDESQLALATTGLTELKRLRELPEWSRAYVDDYMRRWRLRTASAMHLRFPAGGHALVGIFDPEPDLIDRHDAATLQLLARQLSALARRMPDGLQRALPAGLSDRLRAVAVRVCAGQSNAQIADELYLSVDTVKKYVSRVLAATDCRSRAELIARFR